MAFGLIEYLCLEHLLLVIFTTVQCGVGGETGTNLRKMETLMFDMPSVFIFIP